MKNRQETHLRKFIGTVESRPKSGVE